MATEMISTVWPEWKVEKTLGKGSYGTVYKAIRSDSNINSSAAIKVISIPMDQSELESLRSEGLTEEDSKTYFRGIVNDFISEIRLMESLKGTQNIVSVEDYKVIERENEIGWEIYIRMELLTPFNTYICDKKMSEAEVLKLGIDICSALEICEQRNVVHRDIKPENIFINDFGYFKLGDFGIARTLENATGGLSQKGTFNYMAPEIATGRNYDARVDIYSLGIVLYRLLNGNRLPFIDNESQLLSPNARKIAVDRRMRGDQMTPPCEASPQAADVIMRACAYSPQARFATATEMKRALQQVESGSYVTNDVDLDKTVSVRRANPSANATPNPGVVNNAPNVQGWNRVAPVTPAQPVSTPVKSAASPAQPVNAPVSPAKTPAQPVAAPVQPVKRPVQPTNSSVPFVPAQQGNNIPKRAFSWFSLWGILLSIAGLGNAVNERFVLGLVCVALAMIFTLIGKAYLSKTKGYNIAVSVISVLCCMFSLCYCLVAFFECAAIKPIFGALLGIAIFAIFLTEYLIIGKKKKIRG